MPFEKGNQIWKLRSNRIPPARLFDSPDALLNAAYDYFDWCESNPLMQVEYRGKEHTEVHIPKVRAFAIQGLCVFIGCNKKYFYEFKQRVEGSTDELSEQFTDVIDRIFNIIYYQKFTAAAAGLLSRRIILRDLGLGDKQEANTITDVPEIIIGEEPLIMRQLAN